MTHRLWPGPLFHGHWKSLADVRTKRTAKDWISRIVLGLTVVLFPVAWKLGWSVQAPVPILAGVALLGGALIGSFGQINTLRLKMTDRVGDDDPTTQIERDAVDESAAHLLTAAYMCGVSAAFLALGINFSPDLAIPELRSAPAVQGFWAAAAVSAVSYTFVTFLIAVPRLYQAYDSVNRPSDQVSGYHR